MKEEIKILSQGSELIAKLSCEIDHHTAQRLRERIDMALFEMRPRILVLDFSGVGFMDSSGLGLILGRVDKAAMTGAFVEVRGLGENLLKLVRLSGVEKIKNLSVKQ